MRTMFGKQPGEPEPKHRPWKRLKRKRIDDLRQILGEATRAVDDCDNRFFYVWRFDFRGRAYPRGRLLTPQGRDEALALLRFHASKPLGEDGVKWLAICGSNELPGVRQALGGTDTLDRRIAWVEANTKHIRAAARDPIKHVEFWSGAKDGNLQKFSRTSWQALRFCMEWDAMHDQGKRFASSLPVAIDGTCNAVQHFAGLTRDPRLANDVNLASVASKQDIYGKVGALMPEAVAEFISSDGRAMSLSAEDAADGEDKKRESTAMALKWLLEQLGPVHDFCSRNFCKPPVMTLPYGAGTETTVEELGDLLEEQYGERWRALVAAEKERVGRAMAGLVRCFSKVIAREMASAIELRTWLRTVAKRLALVNEPITWESALGLPIWQFEPGFESKRFEVGRRYLGHRRTAQPSFTLYKELPDLDDKAMVNGIVANFVHSMDAAHMMMTTLSAMESGITDLRMVHDSFGCHASDMERLRDITRQQFAELYTGEFDTLRDLMERSNAALSRHGEGPVPSLPARGSFDLREVERADYFFC